MIEIVKNEIKENLKTHKLEIKNVQNLASSQLEKMKKDMTE